jgi:glycosyltransferase involved in cell wall biosynthesis
VNEKVSLILTVKNEARTLERFLRSLEVQSRFPDEVVIVDGGSTDGTVDALLAFADTKPNVRVHVAEGASIAQGRNIAIEQAGGPIVAVTDAGTLLAPDWLAELVLPLELDPQLGVSSGFFVPGGTTPFERLLTTVITPQLPEIDPEAFLPSSRSVAFRKEWWARVGGYPEWLQHCEDLIYDMALKDSGAKFNFAPTARVTWSARKDLRSFSRQYYNYARGDGHAHLYARRHAIRYGSYAAGLILLSRAKKRPFAGVLLAVGMLVYFNKFFARVLRYPQEPERPGLHSLLLVPLIVIVGDIGKMIGYPVGLYQRWRAGDVANLESRLNRNVLPSATKHVRV